MLKDSSSIVHVKISSIYHGRDVTHKRRSIVYTETGECDLFGVLLPHKARCRTRVITKATLQTPTEQYVNFRGYEVWTPVYKATGRETSGTRSVSGAILLRIFIVCLLRILNRVLKRVLCATLQTLNDSHINQTSLKNTERSSKSSKEFRLR